MFIDYNLARFYNMAAYESICWSVALDWHSDQLVPLDSMRMGSSTVEAPAWLTAPQRFMFRIQPVSGMMILNCSSMALTRTSKIMYNITKNTEK